jgi:hypothetical protein
MKLTELGYTASSKKINRINESRFGFAIDFDNLTIARSPSWLWYSHC